MLGGLTDSGGTCGTWPESIDTDRGFCSQSMYFGLVGEAGTACAGAGTFAVTVPSGSADSRRLRLSSSTTFGRSGLFVAGLFATVDAAPGSDRRRIDNFGAVNEPKKLLEEPGLEPSLGEVIVLSRLLEVVDGDGLVPPGTGTGDVPAPVPPSFCGGFTLRQRFFAPAVTSSPISTTSLLQRTLSVTLD